MKSIACLAVICSLSSSLAASSGPDFGLMFLNAHLARGSALLLGADVTDDGENSFYVSGQFGRQARFGTNVFNVLNDSHLSDGFVAKYDRQKNCLWARQFRSAPGHAVAFGTGALFVAGALVEDTQFMTATLRRRGKCDAFLAKFDAAGNLLWVKQDGGLGYVQANGVAVDATGNSYITGNLCGAAEFDEIKLVPQGSCNLFVAKHAPNGELFWAKRDGCSIMVGGRNAAGHVYVTGPVSFGSAMFGTEMLTAPNALSSAVFLVKYDLDGKLS